MEESIKTEIIEDKYSYVTYLIGSMEKTAEGDDGGSRREIFEQELLLRNVYSINPVKLESKKTGMSTDDVKQKMVGWIASGNWKLFGDKSKEIWLGFDYLDNDKGLVHVPGDIDYVKMADWLTFSLNKGDAPCGSYAECGMAMEHGIPIFLITNIIKKELPKSLLQMICVTEGEVFANIKEYLEFVDKKYNLKRQKEADNGKE